MTNFYECAKDIVHAQGAGGQDYTLCGLTADTILDSKKDFDPDNESDVVVQMVETKDKVTCPDCATIIRHCCALGTKSIAKKTKDYNFDD